MTWQVIEADCVERMKLMDEASVDAVVTDPPAGISFMGRGWDSDRSGDFVAWLASVMEEALRVTKPGGHALVWALPRTSHWTGSAIEAAGWEIRDRIAHHFGSGFPKSHNLGNGFGTALKPATEDWWLARKPLIGTVAQNVERFGTGALNVDACRIGFNGERVDLDREQRDFDQMGYQGAEGTEGVPLYKAAGRWPANVALSHLPECGGEIPDGDDMPGGLSLSCVEGCPVAELDRQSGEAGGAPGFRNNAARDEGDVFFGQTDRIDRVTSGYGDSGGASRFFLTVSPDTLCVQCGLPLAASVGKPSPPSEALVATAPDDVQGSQPLEQGGSGASSDTSASGAASPSRTTPATPTDEAGVGSAPTDATASPDEPSDPSASDAGPLCRRCTTATAQSDAAISRPHGESESQPESRAGRGSTPPRKQPTPTPNSAPTAESPDSIGTMSNTRTPPSSSGSAPDATPPVTPIDAEDSGLGQARFRYVSKSSRAERNAGLEGFEERWSPTMNDGIGGKEHSRPCSCDTFTEWVNEGQSPSIQADSATPPPRDTTALTLGDASGTSTTGSGSKSTGRSPQASTFTTSMGTSRTTESETLGSSTRSRTSEPTPRTTESGAASGSDGATSAGGGSPPTLDIGISTETGGSSTGDAAPATSESSSSPSSSVSSGNRCPDCGGVVDGGRVASRANVHPLSTVKPVDLMRWLVRLVTPPDGLVLDPFAGSGTTGIACVLEDFDFIGIEKDESYCAIARARIAHWAAQPKQLGLEI